MTVAATEKLSREAPLRDLGASDWRTAGQQIGVEHIFTECVYGDYTRLDWETVKPEVPIEPVWDFFHVSHMRRECVIVHKPDRQSSVDVNNVHNVRPSNVSGVIKLEIGLPAWRTHFGFEVSCHPRPATAEEFAKMLGQMVEQPKFRGIWDFGICACY